MAFLTNKTTKQTGNLFENIALFFFFAINFGDTEITHFSFNESHHANVVSNNEAFQKY